MITATYDMPGLHIIDHRIDVPLDWQAPHGGEQISVFFREVCDPARVNESLPLLVFLQGGPGGKSPRPTQDSPVWLREALKTYRVILPDQRGTGRSSRIVPSGMAAFDDTEAGARYLACFDAHAIVADLEHIRTTVYSGQRWETLGQSYGGFLTLTYLSYASEGLAACYIAGGLPSLQPSATAVYQRTYQQVAKKMQAYYARYPDDRERMRHLADHIDEHQPRLPNGDLLSVRRFQTLGLLLGMGDGPERLHWLMEEAFVDEACHALNPHFLSDVMVLTGLDENPLFAALHESIYVTPDEASNWAAECIRHEFPQFAPDQRPLFLTGEMIYPWMFEEISALKPFRGAVNALARWRSLKPYYDRRQLARNTVPVAAAVYFSDMYVDVELSLETAESVGCLTYWVTNEYEHDGLRQNAAVFSKLQSMLSGRSPG